MDAREESALSLYLYRWFCIALQSNDGGADVRARDKAVRRDFLDDIRFGIILNGERERTIVLRAGTRLHTIGDFLLYHDGDGLDRCMAFEETHDDRRRDVVWKIGDDLDRISMIVGFDDLVKIELQYIVVDDGDMLIIF